MRAVTGFSVNAICNPESIPRRDNYCNYIWQNNAPGIRTELKRIISKMICYDFRDRYQNVAEILQDLDQLTPLVDPIIEQTKLPPLDDGIIDRLKPDKNFGKFKSQEYKIILPIMVLVASLLSGFIFAFSRDQNSICSSKLEDNLSCGEEILDPLSRGSIRNRAAEQFQQQKYAKALNNYQKSWQKERRDAESLIYYNNALLDANKIDY